MLIPLPNLDDRRWPDLVEESRALLPVLAPEWTDHNASDPGMTVIELFAWVAEMDVYRANQVTTAARRRFLSLVGVAPRPPQPAHTVIAVQLRDDADPIRLPGGTELETVDAARVVTRFRTQSGLTLVRGALRAVRVTGTHGVGEPLVLAAGQPFAPFGDNPSAGAALYLGFTEPLPQGRPATLYATLVGAASGEEARGRVLAELVPDPGCEPVDLPCDCVDGVVALPVVRHRAHPPGAHARLRHHSVELTWEIRAADGTWLGLEDGEGVIDETRAFTLDGRVRLRPPVPMAPGLEDDPDDARWYVRCRLVAGTWDAAPRLVNLSLNAVPAVQAVRPAIPGDRESTLPSDPAQVAELVGTGTGRPAQRFVLADRTVVADSLVVETVEGGTSCPWRTRPDFDSSSGADADLVLDPLDGAVTFGDGEHGRTVPRGVAAHATYLVTRAGDGNVITGRSFVLSEERNPGVTAEVRKAFASGTSVVDAAGGATAETLEEAEGRAQDVLARITRAVTLSDIEALALATPGTTIARAPAIAGLYAPMPCVDAAGMVTVVVVPSLPAGRPTPSDGLLSAVRRYLGRRRLVGTRIEVTAPTYLEVTVRATVAADAGAVRDQVRTDVLAAIRRFLDPLQGGPDGTGWPLGRDVYRTEMLDVVNRVDGVARVEALELVAEGCGVCSNVCVGRIGLVSSGAHEIQVEATR